MKMQGREMKYNLEMIADAIAEYHASNLSWDEIAEKYGIPKHVLQYHRRKWRKEQKLDAKENQRRAEDIDN